MLRFQRLPLRKVKDLTHERCENGGEPTMIRWPYRKKERRLGAVDGLDFAPCATELTVAKFPSARASSFPSPIHLASRSTFSNFSPAGP